MEQMAKGLCRFSQANPTNKAKQKLIAVIIITMKQKQMTIHNNFSFIFADEF